MFCIFRLNIKLGVKVGMVRSVFVCRSGLNALKEEFKKIAKRNDPKDVVRESFVEKLRNETFLKEISKSEQLTWLAKKRKNMSQSLDEALIEG